MNLTYFCIINYSSLTVFAFAGRPRRFGATFLDLYSVPQPFRDVKAKGLADIFLGTDERSDELGPTAMLYTADRPHFVKDILG